MLKSLRATKYSLLAFGAATLAGCGQQQPKADTAPPPKTVEVLNVQPAPLALSSELPGRVEPFRVAEVRARVPGIVLKRRFTEGMDVKAGQVLFEIDPAPFKAALSRAESQLASAQAQLTNAQAVVTRYEPLVAEQAVSQQDFDAARAALHSAQAARQAAIAEIETARLNLGYATVIAPISGRVGRALVTEGALVGQNEATPLATIQQIDHVYVDFKQPVAQVLNLQAALGEGRLSPDGKRARISLTIEGTDRKRDGELLFSDIAVERNTGQVSLRGQFKNEDGLLLPGMYVRVHTPLAVDPSAILVPQRAVQRGVDGKPFVLAVNKEGAADARPVQTGAMHGSDWHIAQGLKAGDQVIVKGQVLPGEKVAVGRSTAAAAADATK